MMPNVTRGDRMGGLIGYLVGPGRENQHTDPHLVAGDPAVMAWHADTVLDPAAGREIARALNAPHRAFGVDVPGGHVWHCSLSLRADEGQLPDETWGQIATEFVERMGFAEDGKAPVRWAAIRHGLSKAGNDHIHIALSLVREDGTKANPWRDRPRAQAVARELETRFGLAVLESRGAGRGDRGVTPGELRRQKESRASETERTQLARIVRAEAMAATSEAEFVRRLRSAGVAPRPRFAAGTDSVVAGYSVGQPGGVRLGGGQLARDLTLPRLREWAGWPDTPDEASGAVAEWSAAHRGRPPVGQAAAPAELPAELWDAYTAEVDRVREWLRTVPTEDRATWARVAGEAAGVFAAWSRTVEGDTPGPLAAASDSLARSAQIRAHEAKPARRGPSMKSAALLCASMAHGGRGAVAQAVLLRSLANVAKALHDSHAAAKEAHRAAELVTTARRDLAAVGAALPGPNSPRMERTPEISAARRQGSVLPADLERARAHTTTTTSRDRGPER